MMVALDAMRYGDAVTLHGVYRGDDANGHPVISVTTLEDGLQRFAFSLAEIATHEPHRVQEGDLVVFVGVHGERNLKGRVLSVRGHSAWVDWAQPFPHVVVPLSKIELQP